MRIEASLKGDLKKYLEDEFKEAERAVTLGIKSATNGLKTSLRAQVTSAGMSRKMANTWRGNIYPKGQNSIVAAGLVYSRAPDIMQGFEKGTVIKSKNGFWLAIPTSKAPKRGTDGKRINPSNFPESRYGKLNFVYRSGSPSLLITKKEGKSRAKPKVMFFLVPQVKMPKLINFEQEAKLWHSRLPDLILREWRD